MAQLEIAPKKKKNCQYCGQAIFVRNKLLMTEDDAKIEDWLVRLAQFGITKNDLKKTRQILSEQFGVLASINDTVWRILNNQVIARNSFHTIEIAYYEMARLASMEGKDPMPYCSHALQLQLNQLKSEGVKTVKIVGYGMRSDSSCEKCKLLHGETFDMEIALQDLPIPRLCENEFGCKCSYIGAD